MSKLNVNTYLSNGGASDAEYNNFWDWFCKDTALENRGLALDSKVKFLRDVGIIDGESMYVKYKNNCPIYGKTYDSILVKDLASDVSLFWIIPSSGHSVTKGEASIHIYDGMKEIKFGSWMEMKKSLKVNSLSDLI